MGSYREQTLAGKAAQRGLVEQREHVAGAGKKPKKKATHMVQWRAGKGGKGWVKFGVYTSESVALQAMRSHEQKWADLDRKLGVTFQRFRVVPIGPQVDA